MTERFVDKIHRNFKAFLDHPITDIPPAKKEVLLSDRVRILEKNYGTSRLNGVLHDAGWPPISSSRDTKVR